MLLSTNTRQTNCVAKLFRRLWDDDLGALLATEWVVIATIMILGLIPGLIAVRQGTLSELTEFANATMALNQSYSFSGQSIGCDVALNGLNGAVDGRTHGNGLNTANAINQTTAGQSHNGAKGTNLGRAGVRTDASVRSGVQAFTAGSSAVQVDRLDGAGKRLDLRATPAAASPIDQRPCD
jgi:hypothetical protein